MREFRHRAVTMIAIAASAIGILVVGAFAAGAFDDDQGKVHEPAIDALAAAGILEGTECGEGLICPGEPFERWTMAVWLIRALDETPSTSSGLFADIDPDEWWAPYVERLAELGITSGCAKNPARYCPGDSVTRAQMATFLVRAFALQPGPTSGFADTAGNVHASNIDALAAARFTAGCSTEPARYCPDAAVTRGQMATFVARALGLIPFPPSPTTGALAPFTEVATSEFLSCALRADGTVECWGWNSSGEAVAPEGRFEALVVGTEPCGIRVDGSVVCWDQEGNGAVGPPSGTFDSISGGWYYWCGLRTDSAIDCWGRNEHGQASPPEGRFAAVTAGQDHACALRIDGTATCWGQNEDGQADAPEGQFTAIGAGYWHTCGLRTDGRIICWGSIDPGPPDDEFSTLVSGDFVACGLRTDRTVACWGNHGEDPSPDGEFTAISVDLSLSCGLRTDGSLACWAFSDLFGWTDPPEGRFTAVDAGLRSCAVRDDGTVACWGVNPWWSWRTLPPDGQFTAVDTGGVLLTCALATGGAVECWGRPIAGSGLVPPPGRFSVVATGRAPPGHPGSYSDHPVSCAIRADDRTIDCWGSFKAGSPGGQFSSIDGGPYGRFCGIRTDGTVACWRWNRTDDTDVPTGRFEEVAAGRAMSCGIRVDGTVECWGEDAESGESAAPAGRFTAISSFDSVPRVYPSRFSSSGTTFCGLRTDGSITCWGTNQHALAGIPEGRFTAVATGETHACALREDGAAVCWGSDEQGQSSPPDGRFSAITAGDSNTCGLLADGTVTCWGHQIAVPAPDGVQELGPDPYDVQPPEKTTTRHIAFVSALPNDPAVFVVDTDGSNERRLTDHRQVSGDPEWSPDGKRIAFTSRRDDGIFLMRSDGRDREQRLTRFGGRDPVWSPAGDRIVFTRYIDGTHQVFVMSADGTEQRQLTHEGGADPDWSPDGSRIAFTRSGQVYLIEADGTGERRLTDGGGTGPAWSPVDDRVAFARFVGGESKVFVIGADGTDERRLTRGVGRDPAWSPDGSRLAFAGDGGIFVVGSDGTDERRLTRGVGRDPVWSPDGSGLAFAGDGGIFVVGSDGSDLRQVTDRGGWDASWSPEGDRIAFTRYISSDIVVMDRDGTDRRVVARDAASPTWLADGSRIAFGAGGNVHTVHAHGTDRRQVTRNGGWNPAWSPDGHRIAFTRDGQIFTVRPDGTGERQVTSGSSVDRPPLWSPDSRLLAYSDGHDLFVVDSDGSGVRRLTSGGGRDPSWSADSSRIAFTARVGDFDEVFVIGVDGRGRRQLTNGGGWDPAWSPDGSAIAFSSRAEVDASGGVPGIDLVQDIPYIGLIKPDGDPDVRVVTRSGSGRRPVWSPDGTLIIYTVGDSGWLGSIRPDGSDRGILIPGGGYLPVWSPASR